MLDNMFDNMYTNRTDNMWILYYVQCAARTQSAPLESACFVVGNVCRTCFIEHVVEHDRNGPDRHVAGMPGARQAGAEPPCRALRTTCMMFLLSFLFFVGGRVCTCSCSCSEAPAHPLAYSP